MASVHVEELRHAHKAAYHVSRFLHQFRHSAWSCRVALLRTTGCRHRGLPSSVFLNPSCGFMNIQFTLQNFSCYRQFNIQQSYILPTQLYFFVMCGSESKQRLFPYTTLTVWFV